MSQDSDSEADVADLHIRKLWKVGSQCKVYSRSKRKWYAGRIISIYYDAEGEWLKVRYNKTNCKHIQRLCRDIQPDEHDRNALYSTKASKLFNFDKLSFHQYLERLKLLDELLIAGYLRREIQTNMYHHFTNHNHSNNNMRSSSPSITTQNLICKFYHKAVDISEFKLLDTLGTGTFGTVRVAQHNKTRRKYALKILEKHRLREMQQESAMRNEIEILQQINQQNPFIISMLLSFNDAKHFYLLFELLPFGCEFFDLLQTYNRLNITQCIFYAAQIVLIFEYLHSNHIIYRDLKPENLMYGNDGYLKLIDFGFAKKVNQDNQYKTYTVCGTPEYLAPEIVLNQGHSFQVDWWSLGVLIFEMFTGFTPFDHENVVQVYVQIVNHSEQAMRRIFAESIDHLHPNSKTADSANISNLKDIISKLLVTNPMKRMGANSYRNDVNDIKCHPFFSIIDWNKMYHKQYTNTPKHSPVNKPSFPPHAFVPSSSSSPPNSLEAMKTLHLDSPGGTKSMATVKVSNLDLDLQDELDSNRKPSLLSHDF